MMNLITISIKKISSTHVKSISDIVGASASGLCILHCLATPFFFIASTCSSICCATTPSWWQWMDYLFLAISLFAIKQSTKSSTNEWIIYGLWINWLVLCFSIINIRLEWIQLAENFKFIPAFALAILHIYNLRYCQCNENECCE